MLLKKLEVVQTIRVFTERVTYNNSVQSVLCFFCNLGYTLQANCRFSAQLLLSDFTFLSNSARYNFWLKKFSCCCLSREAIDQFTIRSHLNSTQFITPPIKICHIFKFG